MASARTPPYKLKVVCTHSEVHIEIVPLIFRSSYLLSCHLRCSSDEVHPDLNACCRERCNRCVPLLILKVRFLTWLAAQSAQIVINNHPSPKLEDMLKSRGYDLCCRPESSPFEDMMSSIHAYFRPTLGKLGFERYVVADVNKSRVIFHDSPKKPGDLGWDDYGRTNTPGSVHLVWQCSFLTFTLHQYFEQIDGRGIWVNGYIDPVIHSYKSHPDGEVIEAPTLEYLRKVWIDAAYPTAKQLRAEQTQRFEERRRRQPFECLGSPPYPSYCPPDTE